MSLNIDESLKNILLLYDHFINSVYYISNRTAVNDLKNDHWYIQFLHISETEFSDEVCNDCQFF